MLRLLVKKFKWYKFLRKYKRGKAIYGVDFYDCGDPQYDKESPEYSGVILD